MLLPPIDASLSPFPSKINKIFFKRIYNWYLINDTELTQLLISPISNHCFLHSEELILKSPVLFPTMQLYLIIDQELHSVQSK